MLVQVRTALWSLLQVNLLHTVRRVTHHKLLLSLLVMTAAIVVGTSGPWQSHGDSLNLQEADKAVGIHDSLTPTLDYCSAILLLFVLLLLLFLLLVLLLLLMLLLLLLLLSLL